MRTLTIKQQYASRADTYRLYYLTDLHVGARACDEALLKRDIQAIAEDEYALWIGGGDYIDAICHVGDKRYLPSVLARWALGEDDLMGVQADYVVSLFAPIAYKCIGMVKGNHEWVADRHYARNIYAEIVKGVASHGGHKPEDIAIGASGFINIAFKRGAKGPTWQLTVYCHHGYGGGKLPGGHALALGRVLGDYECNLALMGHRHVQAYVPKRVVRPKARGVAYVDRIGMFVPSYLDAYIEPGKGDMPIDSYVEQVGLTPHILGTTPIIVEPDKQRIEVRLSNQPGLRLVEQAA